MRNSVWLQGPLDPARTGSGVRREIWPSAVRGSSYSRVGTRRAELRGNSKVYVSLFQLCDQLIDRKKEVLSVGMRRAQDKFL